MDRARDGAALAPPRFGARVAEGLAGSLWIVTGFLTAQAAVAAPGPLHVEIRQQFVAPSGFVWWAVRLTNTGTRPVTIMDLAMRAVLMIVGVIMAGRHGSGPFFEGCAFQRSTHMAMPMPPPMHKVASPFLASRRPIS